jgi:dihydroflavonol-4-reductase
MRLLYLFTLMDISDKKILITGASGGLGRQLIHCMTGRGLRPIAHCRTSSDTAYIDKHGLEKRFADLRDTNALREIVQGIDAIIHTAAIVNFRKDRRTHFAAVNVLGAVDLYKAARDAGVQRFVHMSTVGAIGAVPRTGNGRYRPGKKLANEEMEFNLEDLHIPYILTKHAAEVELMAAATEGGPELIIVNPSIMASPSRNGSDREKALKSFNRVVMPDIPNLLNVVDVRDVAPAVVAALERGKPGNRYILAGDNINGRDFLLAVSEILGKTPHLLRIPRWALNWAARLSLLLGTLRGKARLRFYPDIVKLLDYDWAYSSLKARAELGFRNRSIYYTLEDLLNDEFVDSWQKESAH